MTDFRTLYILLGLLASVLGRSTWAADTILPIPNGGFEQGLEGWQIPPDEGMSSLSTEQVASGKYALKILDTDPENGSSATAARIPVQGEGTFEIRGRVFPVSGSGLGIYVRILNGDGNALGRGHLRGLGGSDRAWQSFAIPFYTDEKAAFLEFNVHSYGRAQVEAYLDDLTFVQMEIRRESPWEGQYKIHPDEPHRLTAADVVGPDGIVYPNWTQCGVQGGIPDVKAVASIADFGARPDDGLDDSEALHKACEAAGDMGGGAVVLDEGTYDLDRPVTVRHNNVVIRGKGPGKTRVIFRYAIPSNGVGFYWPPAGSRVGRDTRLEMHARPTGLMRMTIALDTVVVGEWRRSQHSGNSFAFTRYGRHAIGKLPDGPHTLKGVAAYEDGTTLTGEIPVVLDASYEDTRQIANARAAITFEGQGWAGPRLRLAQDGARGDTTLVLESVEGLEAGDRILVDGPATARWKGLTKNACKWGAYRRYAVIVKNISGHTITINQPLRIAFPAEDSSYVRKMSPIQRCGIEDLYIEQTENLWITSTLFSYAWNCWAKNVTVKKCGRFPIYGNMAKWCEIRNCTFDDAWFKGGGGTAYTGWEHSWDCLMENVETFKMRHAPLFQWAASGCVIRNSVFHESDAQWHSGWTNENLMENCIVTSVRGHGGYGYGMWASPPEDEAHGPNGPRNVVYNCDISSPRAGLWMGGMNENWLILYNRFVVENGQGVFAKTGSFDHIIRYNVFVLHNQDSPMVFLATPDCVGVEITENSLYGGNGRFASGIGKPARISGNRAHPPGSAPRPAPAVPSIYQWQKENR